MNRKAFVILCGGILFGLFFPFPDFGFSRLSKLSFDFLHFPVFALLGFLISRTSQRFEMRFLLVGVLFPIAVEMLQPITGREASAADAFHGIVGALTGVIAERAVRRKDLYPFAGIIILTILCEFPIALNWARELELVREQRSRLPVISDTTSEIDRHLWSPIGGEGVAWKGESMRLNGLDLTGYRTLEFKFQPVEKELTLYIRIDDDKDCTEFTDRYNGEFHIAAHQEDLVIPFNEIESAPRGRTLNLKRVKRILIFRRREETGTFELKGIKALRE